MTDILDGLDTTGIEPATPPEPEPEVELTTEQKQQIVDWYKLGSVEFPYGGIEMRGGRRAIADSFGVKVEKVNEVIAALDALKNPPEAPNPEE